MPSFTRPAAGTRLMTFPSSRISPSVGGKKAGDQIEERRFARAVRTNHRAQFTGLDAHRNIGHGREAAEILRGVANL
jgi:hypothetical protein